MSISQRVVKPLAAASHAQPASPLLRGFPPTKCTACQCPWTPHPKGVPCWLVSFVCVSHCAWFWCITVVLPTLNRACLWEKLLGIIVSSSGCSAASVVISVPSLNMLDCDRHVSKYVVFGGHFKTRCVTVKPVIVLSWLMTVVYP